MPVPDLQDIRRPALQLLANENRLMRNREIYDKLAAQLDLTEADRNEILPSGTQSRWENRANWSCYDLFRAGALDRHKRGHYQINDIGKELLATGPEVIARSYLRDTYPDFADFVSTTNKSASSEAMPSSVDEQTGTPEEQIGNAVATLDSSLRGDPLESMAKMDPFRFEQLVVDLLFAMGYGGSRKEAAKVTQKSNDEGIDGVINEDRLGLDVIYVQAKRWQNTVGRKEIQSFVGALAGKQANKGVFITTSDFAKTATDYADTVTQKVILIDGSRLADLMIEHDIGVSTSQTILLKKIDSDYFEEV